MTEPFVPTIHPLTAVGVGTVHAELVALYRHCYAEPPWSEGPEEVAAYAERVRGWASEDGFTGLLARHDDGTLAGATYGWVGPPQVRSLPLPGIDHPSVFHIGDLMVHPRSRRHGLGRRLLDQLVAGRRPAVLVTHPDSDARYLYETAGWRSTGTITPLGSWPMLVYLSE